MKKLNLLFFISLLFMNCASHQIEQQPPFKIISATYSNLANGIKTIHINYSSEKNVAFDSIFYNNQKTKVSFKNQENEKVVFGQFKNDNLDGLQDLQMEGNSKKEFGNKPTTKKEKMPFMLKDNEAIISYKEEGKIKYYKIENLSKK